MDKAKFVEVAPTYYAAAIAWYLISSASGTVGQIKNFFRNDNARYLEHDLLFDAGVRWLEKQGMIEARRDPFGPSIYRGAGNLVEKWNELEKDETLLFHRLAIAEDKRQWLISALWRLNSAYGDYDLSAEDFEQPIDEWEPLPLEHKDAALQAAIESLDKTIEQVRADNGYAATFAEERNFVLEGLTHASRTLKEASATSGPYIKKYVIEPLNILIKRFKDAAISITASAAKQALVDYLKKHGVEWIVRLLS